VDPVATVLLGPAFAVGGCICEVIMTVLGALEACESLTTSCTSYVPALSATNVGFATVALLNFAELPLGTDTKLHL
jgi:hypothetical protein